MAYKKIEQYDEETTSGLAKNYKENLSETANTSGAIDKSLVSFKIQLGALKKADDTSLDEQLKDIKFLYLIHN